MLKSPVKNSKLAIILVLALVLGINFSTHFWTKDNKILVWDVFEYYSYLPAIFVYHDIELSFIEPGSPDYKDRFWPFVSPTGKNVLKMTMGMSILYSPFFLTAHALAKPLGYDNGGYSTPYRFALVMSTVFYLFIGLLFLRKILLKYFSENVTAITLFSVVAGTNLLYYTTFRAAMSHAYSFALFAAIIWLTILWHNKPKIHLSIFIGLLSGLVVLIRPSNVIILVFPALWGISRISDIPERFLLFVRNYYHVVLMIVFFIAVWIPQLLYWKLQTGQYFYYSYPKDEGFFFNNPQVLRALFSFRNGWLIYTPVMLFALLFIPLLFKKVKDAALPVSLFVVLNIYIVTSWWCWWYVGFGNRAFIDSYAVLALPLALFTQTIFESRKIILKGLRLVLAFFIFLSMFQSWQFYKGFITHDSMTAKVYEIVFLNPNPRDRFWGFIEKPDYEKAKQGIFAIEPKENEQ